MLETNLINYLPISNSIVYSFGKFQSKQLENHFLKRNPYTTWINNDDLSIIDYKNNPTIIFSLLTDIDLDSLYKKLANIQNPDFKNSTIIFLLQDLFLEQISTVLNKLNLRIVKKIQLKQTDYSPIILVTRRFDINELMHYVAMLDMAPSFSAIRTKLPLLAMSTLPNVHVGYFEKVMKLPSLPSNWGKTLIIHRQLPDSNVNWRNQVSDLNSRGWSVIADWDDHPSLFSPRIQEAFYQYPWASVIESNAFQTSTKPLLDAINLIRDEEKKSHGFLAENLLLELPDKPTNNSSKIRIFWGALNRKEEADFLAPIINKILKKYTHVELLVIHDEHLFNQIESPNKVWSPAVSYTTYLDKLSSCDIALLCLNDNVGNSCKSNLKFIEASSFGIACICSPTVYETCVTDGKNGLIARSSTDWLNHLERLINDHIFRSTLSCSARDYVKMNGLLAHKIQSRVEWYEKIYKQVINN